MRTNKLQHIWKPFYLLSLLTRWFSTTISASFRRLYRKTLFCTADRQRKYQCRRWYHYGGQRETTDCRY